jgi:hypothetical protein
MERLVLMDIDGDVRGQGPPPISPGEPGPSRIALSGGGCYLTVSTVLAKKEATAPLASGGALPLHWPLCGPDLNLGSNAAK